MSTLIPVRELNELEQLLAQSADRPVLLFKHSHSCGISAEALDELHAHLASMTAAENVPSVQYAIITVQTHREVSNAVAARLKLRHETPQAILVRDGEVAWSASHFRVTAEAVHEAIRSTAQSA